MGMFIKQNISTLFYQHTLSSAVASASAFLLLLSFLLLLHPLALLSLSFFILLGIFSSSCVPFFLSFVIIFSFSPQSRASPCRLTKKKKKKKKEEEEEKAFNLLCIAPSVNCKHYHHSIHQYTCGPVLCQLRYYQCHRPRSHRCKPISDIHCHHQCCCLPNHWCNVV